MRSGRAALLLLGLQGLLPARAWAASPAETAEAARREGGAMYEALRLGRLEAFAGYTYPGVVKQMGGKAEMVAVLRKGIADMADQGFRFVSGKVSPPVQIVKAGKEVHALLPMAQVLSAPGGELHLSGHLLGVSADGGKTWTFIDTAKLTPEEVREVLPTFNTELKLPRKTDPKFIPKK